MIVARGVAVVGTTPVSDERLAEIRAMCEDGATGRFLLAELASLCDELAFERRRPGAVAASAPAAPEPASCSCGHDLESEHGDSGCLRGCPLEACTPPPPEEAAP